MLILSEAGFYCRSWLCGVNLMACSSVWARHRFTCSNLVLTLDFLGVSPFTTPKSRMRFIDILPKEETLCAVFDMPFRPHHLRGHANITIGSIEAAVYAQV